MNVGREGGREERRGREGERGRVKEGGGREGGRRGRAYIEKIGGSYYKPLTVITPSPSGYNLVTLI